MHDINKILSKLSPEKRALLEKRLKDEASNFNSFPLSFSQKRLWFLNQLDPNSTAYNIPIAIRINGNFDIDIAEKSINEIINRHEILRSKIISIDDKPMQVVGKHENYKINRIDLSNYLLEERELVLKEKIISLNENVFHLSESNLFKITVFKLEDTKFVLHIVMHHIISDGWSLGIFIKEFTECYRSYNEKNEPILPELKIQYADFAQWQEKWSKSSDYINQLNYWLNEFKSLPESLKIPIDYPRPKEKKYNGANFSYQFSTELYKNAKTFSIQEGISMFMLFMATLEILLYKYTGNNDITVGTPIANRQKSQIENLIGFFVNTLVIRTEINSNNSFMEYLQTVRDKILGAFDNQDIPFEELVEKLHPDRDMSQTPLFQVMFTYQAEMGTKFSLANIDIESYDIENTKSKFDLSFTIVEKHDKNLLLSIEYDVDLFKESSIEKFAKSYEYLCQALLTNPGKRIKSVHTLLPSEKEFLTKLNSTNKKIPDHKNLVALFEQNLQKHIQLPAIVFENNEITYNNLNVRANQLARFLISKGCKNESIVGIFFERSIDSIIAILSILKTGAAYLPLSHMHPSERINQILNESKPEFIISNSNTYNKNEFIESEIILIDEIKEELDNYSDQNLSGKISPSNLAYIIYTSGSTGKPKGVMIQHNSVLNLVYGLKEKIYADINDKNLKISCNASLIFDASVQQLVQLCFGHTIYIIPEETRLDGSKLLNFIKKERIDVLDCVPTQLKLLIENNFLKNEDPLPLKILPGGEAIDQNTWQSLAAIDNTKFYNMYGPTECTVDSTICEINNTLPAPSIGKPINNVYHYILDIDLQEAPIGVPGQLYIGGNCLSRGYFNRPELTSEKFLPDPYSELNGSRMYATGDLVRYLDDGNIEYIGRIDNQVKLRGNRIELGEIESSLIQIEDIDNAAVLLMEDKLVAYILTKNNSEIDSLELRTRLQKILPDYMVPAIFIPLTEFPLTSSGKIDKVALSKFNLENAFSSAEYIAPTTKIEALIVKEWQEVLEINKISIMDNFFTLGGHSLLAVKLLTRISNALEVQIPLKLLFEKPILRDFSKSVESDIKKNGKGIFPEIAKLSSKENTPLSFQQQRLWFLDQMEPNSSFYNIPFAVRVNGKLDLIVLKESIQKVTNRHEILRTTFPNIDGKPIQKIHENVDIEIKVIELSCGESDKKIEKARDYCVSESQVGFSLTKLPLFDISCLILDKNDFILFTNIHHIISDGWSAGILFGECIKEYNSRINNIETNLPKLPIQYSDYSVWQRNWLTGEELKKRISFWKKYLESAPAVLNLPFDKKRPHVQSYNGDIIDLKIDHDINDKLKAISTELNSTPFMFFLAIFYVLLYRLTDQHDIVLGTPIANRDQKDTQDLIGFFVNTIVIRQNLSGNPLFFDFLESIKKSSIDAFDNKDLPFEKILDSLNIPRDVSYSPLFQVMYSFNHYEKSNEVINDAQFQEFTFKSTISKFDLSLTVQEIEDRSYNCSFEYNTDLFEHETVEQWLKYYKQIVNEVLEENTTKLLEVNLNRNLKPLKWQKEFSPVEPLINRIEAQAKEKPTAIAVKYKEEVITYKELSNRSNYYASRLLKISKQDSLVGIYMDRNINTVVCMLAALKSGIGFIPLNINDPIERIEQIVNDSGLTNVLTFSKYENQLDSLNCKPLYVDNWLNEYNANYIYKHYANIRPESCAYIIYTSGSSGKPKGVIVNYNNMSSFIDSAIYNYELDEQDTILQFASLTFDTCIEEIFPILSIGGRMVLRTEEMLNSNRDFIEAVDKENITILDFPTAFWHQLASELIELKSTLPKSLRTVIIGGERALPNIIERWHKQYGNAVKFINGYGPTEGTVVATAWTMPTTKDLQFSGEVPIGKAIKNSSVFILDKQLLPVPNGIIGELYIGGQGVADGYLNRPAMTSEVFLPNPFSAIPGERIYKTGDLVRLLRNDSIEFIGRVDQQVKIRGFRIELSEIEAAISNTNIVNEVVVIKSKQTNRNSLLAYYTSETGKEISNNDFQKALQSKLPDYMIPANFILINKIPHNSNGKVDRKLLAEKKDQTIKRNIEDVLPNSDKEKILYEIWKDILAEPNIGITDNFFEMGGDSILGIQIISKFKQAGFSITPIQLFQHQTIQQLAAVATKAKEIKAEQGLVSGTLPLIPIQKEFINKNYENRNHWNQALLLKVNKNLRKEYLEETVKIISSHHDALRIRLSELNKQTVTEEHSSQSFEYIDYSSIEGNLKDLIEDKCKEVQNSLNLSDGPIFKIIYFALGETKGRVLLVFHHFVIDGISWRILIEDFQNIYLAFERDKSINLPDKTTSFKEWANEIYSERLQEKLVTDYSYWLKLSQNYQSTYFPNILSGDNKESSNSTTSLSLNKDSTNRLLKEVNSKYNTNINDILLTALILSYSRWSGKRSLFINMESHGRKNFFDDIDLSRTVGWFTTVYPVHLDLKRSVTIGENIRLIKEQIREIPNDGFGYGVLRHIGVKDKNADKLYPLDDIGITFNYLGQFDNLVDNDSIFEPAIEKRGPDRAPENLRDSIIDITGSISSGILTIAFGYSSNLFTDKNIKEWCGYYINYLNEIINECTNQKEVTYTSSDFNLSKLDDKKLNKVLSKLKKK